MAPSSPSPSGSLAGLHGLLTSRYGPLVSVHSSASVREALAETNGLSAAQLLAPAGERVQLNGTMIGCLRFFQCFFSFDADLGLLPRSKKRKQKTRKRKKKKQSPSAPLATRPTASETSACALSTPTRSPRRIMAATENKTTMRKRPRAPPTSSPSSRRRRRRRACSAAAQTRGSRTPWRRRTPGLPSTRCPGSTRGPRGSSGRRAGGAAAAGGGGRGDNSSSSSGKRGAAAAAAAAP